MIKKGLGKGLNALLSIYDEEEEQDEKVSRETVPPCFTPMFHVEQFCFLFHAECFTWNNFVICSMSLFHMKQKCHPFGWHLYNIVS